MRVCASLSLAARRVLRAEVCGWVGAVPCAACGSVWVGAVLRAEVCGWVLCHVLRAAVYGWVLCRVLRAEVCGCVGAVPCAIIVLAY